MPERIIPTRSVELADAAERFEEIVAPVARGGKRVVIERDGRPIAGLISTLDLRDLEKRDAEREKSFEAIREFGRAFADVPLEELEDQVAKALAEARAEMRAERERAVPR